jgi:hypothetical protein
MVGSRQCNRFIRPRLQELAQNSSQYCLGFHDAFNVQKKETVKHEGFRNACDGGCCPHARRNLDLN